MPAPAYSIIIPAFNEAGELPATLRAIQTARQALERPGECIVVDNNSTDGTAAAARKHGADLVAAEPRNQIARARNTGARAAAAPNLIFIDADTRIPPDLLRETLEYLESGATLGGGAVLQFEGETTALGRFGIRLWEKISVRTQTAAGSYLFCRKDAFQAVGGFDEKLYAGEEVRLSRLLRKEARRTGKNFLILTDNPVQTSARKLRWYSGPRILFWVLLMALLPIAVRSRKLCSFWYHRPAQDQD